MPKCCKQIPYCKCRREHCIQMKTERPAPPPPVEPLRSWPSLKRYLANGTEYQQIHSDNQRKILTTYVVAGQISYVSPENGGDVFVAQPSRSIYLGAPLSITANSNLIDGCRLAADGANPCDVFAGAVLYKELGSLQSFLVESEFPAKFDRKLGMFGISDAAWLGVAASIGATEVVSRWASLLVAAAREGYLHAANFRGMQHWLLRLWCRAHDQDYPDTGYPRYDIAEGILEIWNTQDTDTLGTWLVQLCNLHTRLSTSKQFNDFANFFSHFPVEVLLLFRLREQAGLANPEVDHPIMKFPWSRLWPIKPAEPDELLSGIYRRLETNEGITVSGLYQQFLSA
jgi:hypothetical protein